MLRYIVNQSKMYKSNFINHYKNLHKNYKTAEEITEKSILKMKERIKQKASQGRTKYSTYLEINPSLCKPNVYDMNIPTFKLQQLTKCRMGNHKLQVEDENHFLKLCHQYNHVREKYKENLDGVTISRILDDTYSADYKHGLNETKKLSL